MLDLFDLSPRERLLAQLALSRALITTDQLQGALTEVTDRCFFSLGEVMIGQGLVTLAQLDELLQDYCSKLRLGELAMARGVIDEHQLEVALAVQNERENPIGELFVELHFASPQQIQMLIDYQARLREASVV